MADNQTFFAALNAFFDHVYVITLRRAADRHEHIRRELAGLDYEWFYGKDKQQISIDDLQQNGIYSEALARQHHRYGKPMQIGQIGCAWSHAEVYRDVVEKGYTRVLVLEDDVVVAQGAAPVFASVQQELPQDWELLYFGYAQNQQAPTGYFFKKNFYHLLRAVGAFPLSHRTISHRYPIACSAHVSKAGYHDCTHAYAITQTAAQTLLALQQPVSFVADNLLAHAVTNGMVSGYLVRPPLLNQLFQTGVSSFSYLNQ